MTFSSLTLNLESGWQIPRYPGRFTYIYLFNTLVPLSQDIISFYNLLV
jgi:hypothetical protein